jgi:hypothetical protein
MWGHGELLGVRGKYGNTPHVVRRYASNEATVVAESERPVAKVARRVTASDVVCYPCADHLKRISGGRLPHV